MRSDINIIANSQVSFNSMGGSDKIFIELALAWKKMGYVVNIFGCREAGKMCVDAGLKSDFREISRFDFEKFGLLVTYFLRTVKAFLGKRTIKSGILYSSSDFFPDLFFALKQKILNPRILWLAGLFLIAPNPFRQSYSFNIRGFIYWISQRIGILIMKVMADYIVVLCKKDKNYLIKLGFKKERIIIISGGVDMDVIKKVSKQNIIYEACFVGRFHSQKGILQLIDIWGKVCIRFPKARLAIVGWGDESWIKDIKSLIEQNRLTKNIFLLGFLDNEAKYKVLKSSKVFVFPSLYESWGIVVAEAFGCGLPVVAFDIEATKKFKKGIIKIKCFELDKFAKNIEMLLVNKKFFRKMSIEARSVSGDYSWEKSANLILNFVDRLS